MPETDTEQPRHRVVDLKAGAHVMTLDAGVFCVFHAPGQVEAGPSGLPGVRISRAPGVPEDAVEVVTFAADGWMGAANSAALVRVRRGPAGVMVTTYQDGQAGSETPRLQVISLISGVPADPAAGAMAEGNRVGGSKASVSGAVGGATRDVVAHIQRRGDVGGALGEWIGQVDSKRWIEGFAVRPEGPVRAKDIEYQAVLGRGWLSPWSEGGQFCGSRGMSLPILGLRVRLKGEAAHKWTVRLAASFTDGTKVGPIEGGEEALQAESLAPLEGFQLEFVPVKGQGKNQAAAASGKRK
ncbi:hypothetical protein CO583_09060 [Parasaccharibacter sp. TMW2.1882]|uniref:hypothetical protein n=2 Tax=Acetobacterales TaxID=3120395 RepID=UPI0009DA28CC|nr:MULTISPECIES: hypothetical protein [Parasaccharibacter]MUH01905.1 hypothetical protein [Bombella sp. ESL0387]QGT74413.1 hypothetical protein GN304_00445 [Bombella sp. ESL0368]MCK8637829.1 hypothetical protein [Parasaccharibacter sp. TMW2.1885]MCL1497647.1 hypothetical protein [Parasaccharibacter sp. TMW2.1882]MCL1512497.1 hypothetical protein [Parasaccharibacter sp. TMW 2.1884]